MSTDDVAQLVPLNRRHNRRWRSGPRTVPDAVAIAELAIEAFRDAGFELRLAGRISSR
jgi:hypothetical protein